VSNDFERMDDDNVTAAVGVSERRLVPMQVGSAVVYIEAVGADLAVEEPEEFHAAGVDPKQAFETASDALKECVHVVGERIEEMKDAIRPDEVGIEFTIAFEVGGKATIIPVLLTGAAKTQLGVKVAAKWALGEPQS
jgi:Trypsin-co-occurring domain 1